MKDYKRKEIFKAKRHIQRVFPQLRKVDIKVNKLPNGEFQSFIRVLASKRKEFIARKRSEDFKKSLEKSCLAIISQIDRLKTKRRKKGLHFEETRGVA